MNFSTFITSIKTILPTAVAVVDAVESALPGSVVGGSLLGTVENVINDGLKAAGAIESDLEALGPTISNIVSDIANFRKTNPAPASAPTPTPTPTPA